MNCVSFSIFYENEKQIRVLKIQSKNLFQHENSSQEKSENTLVFLLILKFKLIWMKYWILINTVNLKN